ncbi:MAG: hypothetical protein R3F60_34125, partial [bacterium]
MRWWMWGLVAALGCDGEQARAPTPDRGRGVLDGAATDVGAAADASAQDAAARDAGGADAGTPDAGEWARCVPLATHLEEKPAMAPADDCAALEGDARFLCAEHWFWWALSDDLAGRPEAHARLTALIDATDPAVDGVDLGRMHALRGQVAMALLLENGDVSYLPGIIPDFEAAIALDPQNAIIPTW